MARPDVDSFVDAFDNVVYVGDTVVYAVGEKFNARLQKGVVERIQYGKADEYSRPNYRIQVRNTKPVEDRTSWETELSPLEKPLKIMRIDD